MSGIGAGKPGGYRQPKIIGTPIQEDEVRMRSTSKLDEFVQNVGVEYIEEKGECTACNKKSKLVLEYTLFGMPRKICRNCCIRILDRLFGVTSNEETETILFGEEGTKK